MTTYLHQVIAAERGAIAESEKKLAEVKHILAIGGERNPLTGLTRTYQPRAEDGDELPPERRNVQLTVPELLTYARTELARLFDVKYAREQGNTEAKADVVIDGTPLLRDVPAGYLLFLENQVTQLIALIEKLPTLDPAEEWHDSTTDPALPENIFATTARQTARPAKVRQVQVISPNQVIDGKPFPGTFQPYDTDKIVGDWTMIRFSGELRVQAAQEMRARAVRVLDAVRKAREQANRLEITQDQHPGDAVLGYIGF